MSRRHDQSHQSLTRGTADVSGLPSVSAPGLRPLNVRGGRSRSASASREISPRFLLNALMHWWKVAMPVGLILAAGAAAVVWWSFEPVFMAHAMIQIRENPPALVFTVEDKSTGYVETQKEMLRSGRVLRPVVESAEIRTLPELRERRDKVAWLQRELRLVSVGKSEFLRVEFQGPNPENAAKIVNSVVKQYFELLKEVTDERVLRVISLLADEIHKRKEIVEQMRKSIQQRTLAETGKDPFANTLQSGGNWPHPLAELQSRLTAAEVEREVLEAEAKAMEQTREQLAQQPDEALAVGVARAVDSNVQVQTLSQQIWTGEATLRQMQTLARNPATDPQCIKLAQDLAQYKEQLAELRRGLAEQYRSELRSSLIAKREEELAAKRLDIESRRRMEEALRERYENELKKVVPGIADMVSLEFEQAELTRATDVLNRIEQRVVELRTERQAPARVVRFDDARAPDAPMVEIPLAKMGLAGLVAFCIPFGLAIGWERIVRRISGAEELEQETNLAVIGEIARLPEKSSKVGKTASRRMAQKLRLYEESIDSMRTFLVLAEELKGVRVLAVTSAASNEGKTSVASQLALSLARASGKPTLLIDGDMRAPDLQEVFEVRKSPGLAEVLGGACDLEHAIVPTWTPSVDVLPAGEAKQSVHKLVGNGELTSLLRRVSEKYAYVVLDTPPVLAASESLVLAKAADVSLICAMQDMSRAGQVRAACERLVAAGCRPVAAVLNGVSPRRYEYNYGYYESIVDEN